MAPATLGYLTELSPIITMAPATLGYLTELSPIITWLKKCNFPCNHVTVCLEQLLNGLLKKLMQLTC